MAFSAVPFLAPEELRCFAPCQNMAPDTEETVLESGCAATAGTSQGQWEAAADGLCPICLDTMDNVAHIGTCLHTFCFACIRQWAAVRATCLLCWRHFGRILHTVRADDDYEEYVLSSPTSTTAGHRVRSRSLQRRYNLRPQPHGTPGTGSAALAQTHRGRAPGPSNPSAP